MVLLRTVYRMVFIWHCCGETKKLSALKVRRICLDITGHDK